MLGIKSPEILKGMNLAAYKKRLFNVLKKFKEETQTAISASKPAPLMSFAILPEFEFDDGQTRQVVILDLSTKWVRYVKTMRKEKKEMVMGECSIDGTSVFFDVKRKIKLTKTDILRENKRLKYNVVFEKAKLEFSLTEDNVQEEMAVGTKDVSFAKLGELIAEFKEIDEEKEALQIQKLKEITQAISTWRSDNKTPTVDQIGRIEKIEQNVAKQTRLIELELADEAWADYHDFQENEQVFPTDQIDDEIKELETLYKKWHDLFNDDPGSTEKGRMNDLKLKIKEEREQYAELLVEEEGRESAFSGSSTSLGDIKSDLDEFKKLGKEALGPRLLGIDGLLEKINFWLGGNPDAEEKPKGQMEKLKSKLATEREKILEKEDGLVTAATEDFDDFQSSLKGKLDSLEEIEQELNETKKLYEDWKSAFETYGKQENNVTMTLLESDIQEEADAFEELKEHTTSIDDLFGKFADATSTEKRLEHFKNIEKLIAEFPS